MTKMINAEEFIQISKLEDKRKNMKQDIEITDNRRRSLIYNRISRKKG